MASVAAVTAALRAEKVALEAKATHLLAHSCSL